MFPAVAAAVAPLAPQILAACATYCAVTTLLLALAPTWQPVKALTRARWPLVLMAVSYGLLLAASWQTNTLHLMVPGSLEAGLQGGFNPQFFPNLSGISALFASPGTPASFLLHVMFINLAAARWVHADGIAARVPVAHSVLLSAAVGPLGLLSHLLTKAALSAASAVAGRDLRSAEQPLQQRSGEGTIIILPYGSDN